LDRAAPRRWCSYAIHSWWRCLGDLFSVPVGVCGGCRSECGLLGLYVHRCWHFLVDSSPGRFRSRCSLVDSYALMRGRCISLCLPGVLVGFCEVSIFGLNSDAA
jgi:hypothetical protein